MFLFFILNDGSFYPWKEVYNAQKLKEDSSAFGQNSKIVWMKLGKSINADEKLYYTLFSTFLSHF